MYYHFTMPPLAAACTRAWRAACARSACSGMLAPHRSSSSERKGRARNSLGGPAQPSSGTKDAGGGATTKP